MLVNGNPVEEILAANDTFLVFRAPNGTAGNASFTLYSDQGANFTTEYDLFTFATAGVIATVAPASGRGGTRVVLTGTTLGGGGTSIVDVRVGGVSVREVVSATNSRVEFIDSNALPAGSTVDVEVIADSGARVVAPAAYRPVGNATITSVTPTVGQNGTVITITGANLLGGGATFVQASIGGVGARILMGANDTSVEIQAAGGGAGTGDIVLVADSGAETLIPSGFTYLDQGIIASVTPASGREGTVVSVVGTNLLGGGSSVFALALGGTVATVAGTVNDTLIVVRAAAAVTGTGDVEIVSDIGSYVSGDDLFTYLDAGAITGVSPERGTHGTQVTVTGSNLLGGGATITTGSLGGVPVEAVVAANDTVVVLRAGYSAGVTGTDAVSLVADSGAVVTNATGWTYRAAGNITSVTPAFGQQGTRVTVTGTDLLADGAVVVAVSLAGVDVAAIVSFNATSVVVVANASAVIGSGDVVLRVDTQGLVTLADGFEYRTASSILRVSPSSGPQGTEVTVLGVGLFGHGTTIVDVILGGTSTQILFQSAISVTVTAGNGSVGVGDVVVTADTGAFVRATDAWTQLAAGTIETVSPSSGTTGTRITIVGTGLLAGRALAAVTVAGVPGSIVMANETYIVVDANPRAGVCVCVGV